MKTLYISAKNDVWASIDEEDLPRVMMCSWFTVNGYFVARIENRNVYMHRLIMRAKPGTMIDHINRNRLDNRKCNLRFCTPTQNSVNIGMMGNNTTGFKGVRYQPKNKFKKWCARIIIGRKEIYLGGFEQKEDAIEAYRIGAMMYHGVDPEASL